MKIMFSELCDKEVINCASGTSIGYVCDLTFCAEDGKIQNLIVCCDSGFFLRKSENICIPWEKIERIGKDFIIVSGTFGFIEEPEHKDKQGFKTFFSKH